MDRLLSYLGNVGGEQAMQELAQADSRVERMMQLESLFTRDPDLLRDYLKDLRDRLDYENSFKGARSDETPCARPPVGRTAPRSRVSS